MEHSSGNWLVRASPIVPKINSQKRFLETKRKTEAPTVALFRSQYICTPNIGVLGSHICVVVLRSQSGYFQLFPRGVVSSRHFLYFCLWTSLPNLFLSCRQMTSSSCTHSSSARWPFCDLSSSQSSDGTASAGFLRNIGLSIVRDPCSSVCNSSAFSLRPSSCRVAACMFNFSHIELPCV